MTLLFTQEHITAYQLYARTVALRKWLRTFCTHEQWEATSVVKTLRAGCLASGREDGIVEVWDLLDRCHEPVISCTISMAMVTSLCFSPPDEQPDNGAKPASHKQYLAVGGFSGCQSPWVKGD